MTSHNIDQRSVCISTSVDTILNCYETLCIFYPKNEITILYESNFERWAVGERSEVWLGRNAWAQVSPEELESYV